MDPTLDYDTLLERYRDLQKRVTKFSSVEQDLINTRDRLDHELISYKRLHHFGERALREISATGFNALVTEAIVDIFEVEGALVHFRNKADNSSSFELEGLGSGLGTDPAFQSAILHLEERLEKDKVLLLETNDLSADRKLSGFSRAMAARFEDTVSGCSLFIMGIVSREFDGLYPSFSPKSQTIFGIFLKQLQSFFANRIRTEDLRKTNSELDSFVYSVSHDLRAPLLSLQGIIELIKESDNLSTEVKEYLEMADTSVHRLDNNIREILEYSRNARLKVTPEQFSISEMVEEIFSSLKYSTVQEVKFINEVEPPGSMSTDRARLKVLLNNIISNSVKYRRKDGVQPFVKFSMEQTEGRYEMKIEDNGEGIPEGSREKVFDMFYRASTTTAGTGLGLYICREIITKLHGTISLESEVGKGTVVTMVLPKNHQSMAKIKSNA